MEIKNGARISFGKAGSTMMACRDMALEKIFAMSYKGPTTTVQPTQFYIE